MTPERPAGRPARPLAEAAVGALAAWMAARRPRRDYAPAEALVRRPQEAVWLEPAPPGSVRVRWAGPPRAARLYAGEAPPDGRPPLAETCGDTELLAPDGGGRLYHVVFADGQAHTLAERFLRLPGAVNLRDIGGYATRQGRRVRWGRVWRSGSLAGLPEASLAALAGLGLQEVCDLRTPHEVLRAPDRLPAGARWVHQPTYPDGRPAAWLGTLLFRRHQLDLVFRENYRRMADQRAPAFGQVLRRVAGAAGRPILIHCTAGKDRTGIAIALLLLVLGVPEETVVADYALSNLAYDAILAAAADDLRRAASVSIAPEELRPIMTADPLNLEGLLAHLQARHGSIEEYLLTAAGLTPAELADLRLHLLE